MIKQVVLIGAGNLATQLGLAFHENGISISQVYSQNNDSACELAQKVNSGFTNRLNDLFTDADLYVVAVKDAAIPEVLENIRLKTDRLIVHTAGSVPMQILEGFTESYGVFYPLQTFSKSRKADFSDIPICIEASHPSVLIRLEQLAGKLSSTIRQIGSEERKALHLAAVFANNFVNHFYALGAGILSENKLDFDLLKPLIRETAAKIESLHPLEAQTGPALRRDQLIVSKHLKMLQNNPELQKMYSFVTESIISHHQH